MQCRSIGVKATPTGECLPLSTGKGMHQTFAWSMDSFLQRWKILVGTYLSGPSQFAPGLLGSNDFVEVWVGGRQESQNCFLISVDCVFAIQNDWGWQRHGCQRRCQRETWLKPSSVKVVKMIYPPEVSSWINTKRVSWQLTSHQSVAESQTVLGHL